jgi:hypothetical protein
MEMEKKVASGETLPEYSYYYTNGLNIGTKRSTSPTAGKHWRPIFDPIVIDFFPYSLQSNSGAPFTTVMNWQSHDPIEYNGKTYGQKDIEFIKFIDLPRKTKSPLEIAVSGKNIPYQTIINSGWHIKNAQEVTKSLDSYREYIHASKGEFSVSKNVLVATNSGWWSDRSSAYLASGRPVVMQETGFSDHLPCGRGLFAVRNLEEAAEAINHINDNYKLHSKRAHEIAYEHLESRKVLSKFLSEIGI